MVGDQLPCVSVCSLNRCSSTQFNKLRKIRTGASTTPQADPLGLNVLYTPQSPRSADVIFVHGLGGTSVATWSQHHDLRRCWPQLWLPTEPHISSARILSFGYNARFLVSGPRDISGITDFAKSLLFEMKYSKDEVAKDLGIGSVSSTLSQLVCADRTRFL